MKRALAGLALLVAAAASSRTDTQTANAFRAAFGKFGSATLKRQGELKETVKYRPGALVEAPFGPVLLSPGEVIDPAHVSSGKMAAIYLKRTPRGFVVARRFVPATETGSFGVIGEWHVRRTFGTLPVVTIAGGGTWQGYSCEWTTLLELAPQKPRELVTVPLHYDDAGAVMSKRKTSMDGQIAHIVKGRSFEVLYSGSRRFKDRYIRRGDKYVLVGKSRMQTC